MIAAVLQNARDVPFVLRNLVALWRVPSLPNSEFDGYLLRGYVSSDWDQVKRLYKELNSASLTFLRRCLLSRIGARMLIVALSRAGASGSQVVGINLYYVNKRDVAEGTVHEGFIGVSGEHSGRGLATRMRAIAREHFSLSGFLGISTRISVTNYASLRSAQRAGFSCVEEYRDPRLGELRQYLVSRWDENRSG